MSAPADIVSADEVEADEKRKLGLATAPPRSSDDELGPDAVTMVAITAPSQLPAGYQFEAIHDGHVFTVTVPTGGVGANRTFEVPFVPTTTTVLEAELVPEDMVVATEVTPMMNQNDIHNNNNNNNNIRRQNTNPYLGGGATYSTRGTDPAPYGVWKDGLCDCCALGCCHPSICCALWCPQLLMGQVLTRMQMTWCGNSTLGNEYRSTFAMMVILTMIYMGIWYYYGQHESKHHHQRNTIMMRIAHIIYFLYMLMVMTKLRKAVRRRYKIPQRTCHGCEDCCCVLFCGCCTVAQLARQTTDYQQRRAVCCSSTGLPIGATETLTSTAVKPPAPLPEQTAELLV